jgi:PAS domain S-box-containing protein
MALHSQPTILNVDDNVASRFAVTRVLEQHQFRVREAGSGAEALKLAAAELPDLVLLDVNLPDINGFEVCHRLKSDPATSGIPVLHITAAYLSVSDMTKGLESGADSYLLKPVEPDLLIATVKSVLRTRRAEEAARSLAREWQATFDAISDGVAVVDAEGRILRCNESLARILGRPADELAGTVCTELWPGLPREQQPFLRALESRRREAIELEYRGKLLAVAVDPIFEESGAANGAVHIVSDVTERRQLEEQFRESQKFETIGTLAAGVAHDYNNLLTSIMGNASLLASSLPPDSPLRDKLQDILGASQRAADLTRQLLAYSGKGRHFLQKLELSKLVRNIQELIEAAVSKKLTLQFKLASELPAIEADANQVQQVILNLVSNAAEAIGDHPGTVTIATGLEDREYTFLEVIDTGCGMDAETKARIFDPFFTTKFTGRGLGLSAVAGIARSHHAPIQVTSAPGQGSTFRILFTVLEVAAPACQPDSGLKPVGSTTVLVVDDEEMVRRIAQATLQIQGHKVLVAKNGREAVQQVRQNEEIRLVLLDLTMPVMCGEEAIGEILAIRPDVKVVVSTGHDHREALARLGNKRVAGYLQKPYTSRQLGEKIAALLDASAAGQRL